MLTEYMKEEEIQSGGKAYSAWVRDPMCSMVLK